MSGVTNGKSLLLRARAGGYFVPAFNIYNLETMQATLAASAAACQPVILAFGAGYTGHASFAVIRAMAEALVKHHGQEVVLHLDHCRDMRRLQQALDAGFTSVMYDGSSLPYEDNIRSTRQAKALSRPYAAAVEGELGGLNDEGGLPDDGALCYTDAGQAKRFVKETEVDSLAVSIGNAHGLYTGEPHLNLARLEAINKEAALPLVLHGSTGIDLPLLKQAASLGIAKINVNTAVAIAGADAARAILQTPEGTRLEHVMAAARERMRAVMEAYFMQ